METVWVLCTDCVRLTPSLCVTAVLRVQGAGEEQYPFKDLDSSPWKDSPGLLLSAWKRVRAGEWKWRQVINETPQILKGRKASGFASQPFDKKWRQIAKESRGKKEKKGEGEDEEGEE